MDGCLRNSSSALPASRERVKGRAGGRREMRKSSPISPPERPSISRWGSRIRRRSPAFRFFPGRIVISEARKEGFSRAKERNAPRISLRLIKVGNATIEIKPHPAHETNDQERFRNGRLLPGLPVNRSSSDEYSKDKSFAYRKNDFQKSPKIPVEMTAYFPPIYQDFSSPWLIFFVILLKNLSAPIN